MVEAFRIRAFLRSGRDPAHAATWGWDDWDASALHVVVRNAAGEVIGALRVHGNPPWPLEHKLGRSVASPTGMEIGRLTVAVGWYDGRRTLFELLAETCRGGRELGKDHAYGLVVDPLRRVLAAQAIPMRVVEPDAASPYGSSTHLVRFELAELLDHHRRLGGAG